MGCRTFAPPRHPPHFCSAVYNTEIIRTYKDKEGNYHDTHSVSGSELLRHSRLSLKAYDRELELRAEDYANKEGS